MPSPTERLLRAALFASLATAAPLAMACGYCIEDRVAAVYDHRVVEAAVAGHRHVAFLAIEGAVVQGEASRRVVAAALESAGTTPGTARVALDNGACSVAFDPARTSLAALVERGNRALRGKGMTLAALRVIDDGGKLKEP